MKPHHTTSTPPLLAAALILALAPTADSAPAAPALFELTQPDGTTFLARARGDESFGWYETADGIPVARAGSGGAWSYLEQPDTTAKSAAATAQKPRYAGVVGTDTPPASPWQPRPSSDKPTIAKTKPKNQPAGSVPLPRHGEKSVTTNAKMALLAVKFADMASQPVVTISSVEQRLFAKTDERTTLRDLYLDMSFGKFDLTSGPAGISGWHTLPRSRASYGANTTNEAASQNYSSIYQLFQDLLPTADPIFDFGPYDTDNDGYVDCLAILQQGRGEEEGGGPDAIWSHKYSLSELQSRPYSTAAWRTNDTNALGNPVYIDTYIFMPSEQRHEGRNVPSTIGIFAHEYAHALGLPDLYDSDGGSEGLGDWSLMASGSWNGRTVQGDNPAWMDAWSRARLGFVNPINIAYNELAVHIPDAKSENVVYRLWREGTVGDEYFLLENRQKTGFDETLPGAGLLIYHVDDAVTTGNTEQWFDAIDGMVRRTSGHYRVALEQADGKFNLERRGIAPDKTPYGNQGDPGDPFVEGFQFDDAEVPNPNAYNIPPATIGANTYVAVRSISPARPVMTADLYVHADKDFPTATITSPEFDDIALQSLPSFSGTASDAFGVAEVRVAVQTSGPDPRWWNWTNSTWSGTTFVHSQHNARATGTTSWSKSFNNNAFADGAYRVVATAIDTSGAASESVSRSFRIQRDMTAPSVAISNPGSGSQWLTAPVASGSATDNTGIQAVRIALFSDAAGKWYNWSAPGFDSPTFGHALHTTPASLTAPNWSLPLPATLAHGNYQLFAQATDTSGTSSDWKSSNFSLDRAPAVSITSHSHNQITNSFSHLAGTATDRAATGIENNRVALNINLNGQFWNGTTWTTNQSTVHAPIDGDGTWTYTALPDADGSYAVSAHVRDLLGNPSPPQTGVNQLVFRIDTSPPDIEIRTPTVATTITAAPLTKPFATGTATDSSGTPTVTTFIRRLADDTFWNGTYWTFSRESAPLGVSFAGSDGPSRTDWQLVARLPHLGSAPDCMTNGDYQVIATATDAAGNQAEATTTLTVAYNPVWLTPADEQAKRLPNQTPPVDPATITQADLGVVSLRKPAGDSRPITPFRLSADSSGRLYVAARATESSTAPGGPPGGFPFYRGVVARHGTGGWRIERETFLDQSVTPNSLKERWSPAMPYATLLPHGADTPYDGVWDATSDTAGNSYIALASIQRETAYWNNGNWQSYFGWGTSERSIVAKFGPAGNLLWRVRIPHDLYTANWHPDSWVVATHPTTDGSLAVLIDNYDEPFSYFGTQNRTSQTVVALVNPSGTLAYTRMFGNGDVGEDQTYHSTPQLLATGPGNHAFAVSAEDGGQVLRKIAADGTLVATHQSHPCETPQTWDAIAADNDGNLYVAGTFRLSESDVRHCLTKHRSDLSLAWRTFGPPHSASENSFLSLHVGPHGATLVHQVPGSSPDFPFEHPVVSRFSPSGQLLWARATRSPHATYHFGDRLIRTEVDPSGAVLVVGHFGPTNDGGGLAYAKISSAGDLQFFLPLNPAFGYIDTAVLPDGRLAVLVQEGTWPNPEPFRVVALDNPPSVLLPPVLDPGPLDTTVAGGSTLTLTAVNRGSAATFQWFRLDAAGTPNAIPGATGDTFTIAAAAPADTGRYQVTATNPAGSFSSPPATVTVQSPVNLTAALDAPELTWTTGGDAPWHGVAPAPSWDGQDAATSGHLPTTGTSWLRTTVTGPGTLSFVWKVSSAPWFNRLELLVDGIPGQTVSGESDWSQHFAEIEPGQHTLEWRYTKELSDAEGADRAWLDAVSFNTGALPPQLDPFYPLDQEATPGSTVELAAFNSGGPATFQWFRLDAQGVPVAIPDATSQFLTFSPFSTTHAGRYMVTASNAAGTTGSRIATLSLPATPVSLADALDTPGRTWTTGGTNPTRWTGAATAAAHDGVDTATSGSPGDSHSTWLETTVQGPGTARFWWRVSSETGWDFLDVALAGSTAHSITGETAWAQVQLTVPAGAQTIRWTYRKDDSVGAGQDRGFVDQFSFTPSATASPFDTWRLAQGFSPAELADPAISGPTADPDADGLATLIEFVLNLSARLPDAAGNRLEPVETPTHFGLRFTRLKNLTGIAVNVEALLPDGTWNSAPVTLTRESETATTETWLGTIPKTTRNAFLRLSATVAP